MPIAILIEVEDGHPGKEPGETRMQIHLQSKRSKCATARELDVLKYMIAEFQESQLRYGRMNAVRTECALIEPVKKEEEEKQ